MADYYAFLNLKPFNCFHCQQYIKESEEFRKIKDYFINSEHKTIIVENIPMPANITPIEWNDKTTMDVDEKTSHLLLKQSLDTYYEWEHDTCKIYKEASEELFEKGYFDAYCFVRELIDDVEKEKKHIKNIKSDLSAVDYDYNKIKDFWYKLM